MTQPLAAYKLKGKVQHYAWGGFDAIPQLLHQANTEKKPFAEYWLGAHPLHSSVVETDAGDVPLVQLIQQDPHSFLGEKVLKHFSAFPFLLKVLDVRQMLSIQVHPDKASAAAAFEQENKSGLAPDAPNRNYKDDNHKPELMVALSDFWLLHGFKKEEDLKDLLASEPDFQFLLNSFEEGSYKGLYQRVMTMEQSEVNAVLEPVMSRIVPLYKNGELQKAHEDFWAARAVETFCKDGHYDRGIFSIYFFNLLHLKKGEGIYQPAGLPHAYLEGQNVEIMANSDNVLRAGLTDKHIDIDELMKHVQFVPTHPQIIRSGDKEKETVYNCAAAEFEVSRLVLTNNDQQSWQSTGPEIVLLMQGRATLAAGATTINLKEGEAAFIIPGQDVNMQAAAQTVIFRAVVPQG